MFLSYSNVHSYNRRLTCHRVIALRARGGRGAVGILRGWHGHAAMSSGVWSRTCKHQHNGHIDLFSSHTHIHAHTHTIASYIRTHTYMHTHTPLLATYAHTHTCTHIHTIASYIRTHTHTHTCTHTATYHTVLATAAAEDRAAGGSGAGRSGAWQLEAVLCCTLDSSQQTWHTSLEPRSSGQMNPGWKRIW